jgi:hypothetical protein
VYTKIRKALERLKTPMVTLQDISAVSARHPLTQLLAKAVSTGKGPAGLRFAGNTINGVYVADALIYRLG